MTQFVEIPGDYLQEIAGDTDRIPRLYYADNYVLRRVFWQRLYRLTAMLNSTEVSRNSCLDFGGGAGVFLPTLSKIFKSVTLLDLEAEQAELVKHKYQLNNVEIICADATQVAFERKFEAVIAADVLEHFKDLSVPIPLIHGWLKPGGRLYTSLPTENWVYVLLRKFFGIQKPVDHFHTGYEVEKKLSESGFRKLKTTCVPLRVPAAPLFLVTAWERV